MNDMLLTFDTSIWDGYFTDSVQEKAIAYLESGYVLYFPNLPFTLMSDEQLFLSPQFADPRVKNISYSADHNTLRGVQCLTDALHMRLKSMLLRFHHHAFSLIKGLLPHYAHQLMMAKASYRPVQISNRKTSYRKDDKRLHVDAFPSAPNQGKRIVRVFSNINPHGEDRIWRIGEPFEKVAGRFLPQIRKPIPGVASLLHLLKITKSYRTLYDYYMLQIHNRMKADEEYQQHAAQEVVRFPSGSTWIVQTDAVSHAAMQGQYALEQTCYLPIKSMQDEYKAPVRVLEKLLNQLLL